MGRGPAPSTNINLRGSSTVGMYSPCFRAIGAPPLGGVNLSLGGFLKPATAPFVPHWASTVTTNLSIGTYYCNRGYQFWLKLCNMAGLTSTVSSPGQPYNTPKRTLLGAGANNICTYYLSDYQSYFRITATAQSGFAWNSWRTASGGGGSTITTSAAFNAYHTNACVYNRNIWYGYVISSGWKDWTYLGTSPFKGAFACPQTQGGTYQGSGTGLTQTFYSWSNLKGPTISGVPSSSPAPARYYSNGSVHRYWNGSGFSSTAFCPFSDIRVKKDVRLVGKSKSGINLYQFKYKNALFGGAGTYIGTMSTDVPKFAVIKDPIGYDRVDYSKLDFDQQQLFL